MSPPHRPKTIYLHIGLEKTGTTVLQAAGTFNRAWLASHGVLYSHAAGKLNHVKLPLYASDGRRFSALRRSANIATKADFEAFRKTFPADLRAEFEQSGCDTVWLSSEHLSSRISDVEGIARLAAALQPLADQVRVVVYLRYQPDLYLSSYSTFIRIGHDIDIDRPIGPETYYYRFDKILDNWAKCFGRDAMIVRIFDRDQLKNGDIVDDFFSLLGISRDEKFQNPKKKNGSLDGQTVQFMRVFNRYVKRSSGRKGTESDYGEADRLLETISTHAPITVSGEALRGIATMFAPFNQQIARDYFGRPDGKLFREKNYDGVMHTPDLTVEEAKRIGMALCDAKMRQIKKRETGKFAATRRKLALLERDAVQRLQAATSVDDAVRATTEIWRVRQGYLRDLPPRLRQAMAPAAAGAEA
jgi:hypothetical protein